MPDIVTIHKPLSLITTALKAFLEAIELLKAPRRFSFELPKQQQKVFETAIALVDTDLRDIPQGLRPTIDLIRNVFRLLGAVWGFWALVLPRVDNKGTSERPLLGVGIAKDESGTWQEAVRSNGSETCPLAGRIDPTSPPVFGRSGILAPYDLGKNQVELVDLLASFLASPLSPRAAAAAGAEPNAWGSGQQEPSPELAELTAENRALEVASEMVKQRKYLVVSRIAKKAGCSREYLHRSKRFMAFVNAHNSGTILRLVKHRRVLYSG